MNTDTMIGNRLALLVPKLLVPKLCLGTHRSKLCFTDGWITHFNAELPQHVHNAGHESSFDGTLNPPTQVLAEVHPLGHAARDFTGAVRRGLHAKLGG